MADKNEQPESESGAAEPESSIFDLFEPPPERDPNSFGKIPVIKDDDIDLTDGGSSAEVKAAADAEAAGLQHWTAPPTGQIPAVLGSDKDENGMWADVKGPSWHGDDPSWAGPDLADVFADTDSVSLGASLDEFEEDEEEYEDEDDLYEEVALQRPVRAAGFGSAAPADETQIGPPPERPAGAGPLPVPPSQSQSEPGPRGGDLPPPDRSGTPVRPAAAGQPAALHSAGPSSESTPPPSGFVRPVPDVSRPLPAGDRPTAGVPRPAPEPGHRPTPESRQPAADPPPPAPQNARPAPEVSRPGSAGPPASTPVAPGMARPPAESPQPRQDTAQVLGGAPAGAPPVPQEHRRQHDAPQERSRQAVAPAGPDTLVDRQVPRERPSTPSPLRQRAEPNIDDIEFAGHEERHEEEPRHYEDGLDYGPEGGRNIPQAIGVGLALASLVLAAMWFGAETTLALIVVLALLAVLELYNAMRMAGLRPATLLGIVGTVAAPAAAFYRGDAAFPLIVGLTVVFGTLWYLVGADTERPVLNLSLTMMGIFWVGGLAAFGALMIRQDGGIELLLATIIITVASDTMAYIGGRAYGSKPFHHASPNKTWEGTITGFAGAMFAGFAIGVTEMGTIWDTNLVPAIVLGAVVGCLAPMGDLAESVVKRDLGVKDMGTLLPGHGGVLDRVDGLLFALPGAYYLALVYGLI